LGAAAQVGVFVALIGSVLLGFTIQEAGSIGIIGGADGPTAIYLAVKMAPQLLGAIAVAAYSYMSLVIRSNSSSSVFLYVISSYNSTSYNEITNYS